MSQRGDSDSSTRTRILMEAEACTGASRCQPRELEASGTLRPSDPCGRACFVGSTEAARVGASRLFCAALTSVFPSTRVTVDFFKFPKPSPAHTSPLNY